METKRSVTISSGGLLIIAIIIAASAMSSLGITTSAGQEQTPTVKWMYKTADPIVYSPIVTDLDGHNRTAILVVDMGLLYCLDGTGGVQWLDLIHYISTGVAIGDLNGDGQPKIIVARQIWGSLTSDVFCLNATGGPQWNKTVAAWLWGTPTLADLNGDNRSEILIGSSAVMNYGGGLLYPGRLFCFDALGKMKWNYTSANSGIYYVSASDVDGDHDQEVIVQDGPTICCLNASGGLMWNATTGTVRSSPVIADVNNDGKPEIIVDTASGVTCLNGSGAKEWMHPAASTFSDVFVADMAGDGNTDIVVAADNKVYCLNGSGSLQWGSTIGNATAYRLAVADVDGDNKQEVLIGTINPSGVLYCLNATGGLKWSYTTGKSEIISVPIVADVDGDGLPEIIVTTGAGTGVVYCLSAFPIVGGGIALSSLPFIITGLVIAAAATALIASVRKTHITFQREK